MVESSKLTIITESHSETFNFQSHQNINKIYLAIVKNELDVNLNFNIVNGSAIDIKVIVINSNNHQAKLVTNVNLKHDNNNCNIEMLCYGLEKSKTHLVSNVNVNKNSQTNKSNQKITGIMLSDHCRISGEPNLQIETLNVDAKHKLNIGCLDKNELFYLMSKGISHQHAQEILIKAYLMAMVSGLPDSEQKLCIDKVQESLS